MSDSSFPHSADAVVATLSDLLRHQGHADLVELLESGTADIKETGYDNLDGGIYFHTLFLRITGSCRVPQHLSSNRRPGPSLTLIKLRWPNGPFCEKCGQTDAMFLKTAQRWKCRGCGNQFSVKRGTIMEDSPVSLEKWLCAMWLIANCKNGVSSYEIHRGIGVTQKTGWFMLQRIRLAMHKARREAVDLQGAHRRYGGANVLREPNAGRRKRESDVPGQHAFERFEKLAGEVLKQNAPPRSAKRKPKKS